MTEQVNGSGGFRPPYLSFTTFWAFLSELFARPLPPRIDRSLMSSKSGSDQLHLTNALKAFGLVDKDLNVTGLAELAKGDEDDQNAWVGNALDLYYPAQMEVSRQNGTEQQLRESFKATYKIESADTLRKAMTFFLHAAQQGGVELSPHFPSTRGGSGTTTRTRRASARKKAPPADDSTSKVPTDGDRYTVELASGGRVSVLLDVKLFSLSKTDREFVVGLVDTLRGYDPAVEAP